jgi:hypothetical protein
MYKLVNYVLSNCHMIPLKNESRIMHLQSTMVSWIPDMLEIREIFLEATDPKNVQIIYQVSIIAKHSGELKRIRSVYNHKHSGELKRILSAVCLDLLSGSFILAECFCVDTWEP